MKLKMLNFQARTRRDAFGIALAGLHIFATAVDHLNCEISQKLVSGCIWNEWDMNVGW